VCIVNGKTACLSWYRRGAQGSKNASMNTRPLRKITTSTHEGRLVEKDQPVSRNRVGNQPVSRLLLQPSLFRQFVQLGDTEITNRGFPNPTRLMRQLFDTCTKKILMMFNAPSCGSNPASSTLEDRGFVNQCSTPAPASLIV
jgi:hypothetical protein